MKNKMILFIVSVFFVSLISLPIVASAASSSYSFRGIYRIDGKANGQFHSLSEGAVDIDGIAYYSGNAESWAGDRGESVSYTLYRSRSLWVDEAVGSAYHGLEQHNNSNSPSSIFESIGTASTASDQYYIITTTANNGLEVVGSGDLVQ